MVHVKLEGVSKDFGSFRAVDNINFSVDEGEILTLLGPSGCGKSTTLRMIAGFLYPDEGSIYFGDRDTTNLPPQKRNTAMVFQNYALWPHLSVKKNVEFGLNVRKVPKEERNRRVKESLEKVRLDEMSDRMPNKLSGGQQQRVAVARALVINPDVLLLDEPLSNLDAKLRVQTRQEIRDLVKDLNLTTIFVTHDQSEALSISDRIAVLDIGHLRQVGDPENIWKSPTSAFVGSFIGEANMVEFEVTEVDTNHILLRIPKIYTEEYTEIKSTYFKGITKVGETAKCVIRPEVITIHEDKTELDNSVKARINSVMFFGSYTYIQAKLPDNTTLTIHAPANLDVKRNQQVVLEINPKDIKTFGPKNY